MLEACVLAASRVAAGAQAAPPDLCALEPCVGGLAGDPIGVTVR